MYQYEPQKLIHEPFEIRFLATIIFDCVINSIAKPTATTGPFRCREPKFHTKIRTLKQYRQFAPNYEAIINENYVSKWNIKFISNWKLMAFPSSPRPFHGRGSRCHLDKLGQGLRLDDNMFILLRQQKCYFPMYRAVSNVESSG